MRTIAISMHDRTHEMTHHFCLEASKVVPEHEPWPLEFVDRRLPDLAKQITTAPEVVAETALPVLGRLKREIGLGDDDLLVVLVEGNLKDQSNDEYFSVSSTAYESLASVCPGVAIVSCFYDVSPTSAFHEPQADLTRQRKREWWDPKTDERKKVLTTNALLLTILGMVATLATALPEHEDIRGCVMDYCQEPFDIVVAFERGISFTFCDACRARLAGTAEGRQLLGLAACLTANPFRQRKPRIFISYVREDDAAAERLLADLTKRGYDVWKDTHNLRAGERWAEKIQHTLSSYDFAALCLSGVAAASQGYFKEELRRAVEMSGSTPGYALPVAFEACDIPDVIAECHVEQLFPDWERGVTRLTEAIVQFWGERLAGGEHHL
jgi:hypothetical protein